MARYNGSAGAWSTEATVTVVTAPEAPRGPREVGDITLTSTYAGQIEASWAAPSETPRDYRISWAKVGENFISHQDGNAYSTEPTYTITGLEGGIEYKVRVRARYNGSAGAWSTEATVTVIAAFPNQVPRFTSAETFTVTENTAPATTVGTVSAEDADEDDNITGYGIVDGADGSQFEINDQTGVLTFKAAPNYESPADVAVTDPANDASNNEYIVFVTATGGTGTRALTVQATITVTVEDVNEVPVFSSSATFNVVENITQVGTAVANDVDGADSITGYEITGGADQAQFSITNVGALTFQEAPDYENPTDVESTTPANDAANNEYIVEITATGGAGARAETVSQTITVTVTDAEAPGKPATPTVASATFNSLTITWTAPDNTGPEITAYDVRHILSSASEEDKAGYSKWTVKEDAWKSDPGGDLEYTISSLDQNTSYDVQVRAKNAEGPGDGSDTVVGMTSANQAPVFKSVSAVSVNENSTGTIVTVTATYADAADNITGYEISDGADQAKFSIDSTTGALSFKDAPNFENPTDVASTTPANDAANNEYIVVVEATGTNDQASTTRQTITVTVNDVNEPPSSPPANVQVDPYDGKIIVTWDAVADEAGKPPITGYQVERRIGDNGEWEDQQTASGRTTTSLTYTGLTNGQEYQVWVRTVNDEGHSGWSDTPPATPNIIVAIGSIPDQTLRVDSAPVTIDLAPYFRYNRKSSDINYWATPQDATVATERVVGSLMTVTPVGEGNTRITARARYIPTRVRATQRFTVTVRPSNKGESHFGVSTLAKTGESIGVILLKGNLAAVHHYVLEPTQEDHQQKADTFAIDERTGEVRLKIKPAQWQNDTYILHVDLLSQTRNKIGSTTVSIYKKQTITVSPTSNLNTVIQNLSGPATIAFENGTYTNLGRIAFSKTGVSRYDTFEMRAINPGEVTITGNTVFDISGSHNVFHGFIFKDISSNTRIGRTQFPMPITVRGDHNRFTECVFYPHSQTDGAGVILSTSLRANDKVARFLRIDHCAFINKTSILLDNTQINAGDGDGGPEQRQGTNNPISVRVDHNFFQNIEDSFLRLGRVGNRDSESIFDANLIAGNREGDEEHFVGKMGGFLWLNNTVEDCNRYLSLRRGGYAYIVHSYFLQRAAMSIIGWDRSHIIVGNYFRVNGRNTSGGNRNTIAIFRMGEGAAGPQGGHNATTDWRVAYNTFDAPADVPFVNFMGKYSRRAWVAEQLSEAQKKFQEGTYTYATPPEVRYKFTLPINNRFIGNLFYHREAVTSKPQKTFSLIHYGVWEQNTFISNLISSPVTEIYEHDTSKGNEEDSRQITQNLGGLTFISRGAVSRDRNNLLITPTEIQIPQTFRVPDHNKLPIDPNAVIHKQKDNIIDKTHLLYKLMDLRDLGDKLDLNRPLTTRDVGPSWDWQSLYRMLHGGNPYENNYQ